MTIEVLYPKLCNLYGDLKNMDYLKLSVPDAAFVTTQITDPKPWFADHDVDMIYLGSMSEKVQPRVIEALRPYVGRINELIDRGVVFLATGNAWEVFTARIENLNTKVTTPALGLFDLTTKVDYYDRFNGKDMAQFNGFTMVGFRSQFSMVYGDNSSEPFLKLDRGVGINRKSDLEGVRRKNFIGTSLIGPVLVVNPLFTEYLMGLLGVESPKAAFREQAMAAYEQRLKEFRQPKIPFD